MSKPRNPITVYMRPIDRDEEPRAAEVDERGYIWGYDAEGRYCRLSKCKAIIYSLIAEGATNVRSNGIIYTRTAQ